MKSLKERGYTLTEIQELIFDDKYDNSTFVPIEVFKEHLKLKLKLYPEYSYILNELLKDLE